MRLKIGIVTSPIADSGITPLSNYVSILSQFADLFIITGNSAKLLFEGDGKRANIQVSLINHSKKSNKLLKVIQFIYGQLLCSYYIFKQSKEADKWVFFIGGEVMVLPMLVAHLLKRPVFLYMPGSFVNAVKFSKDPFLKPIEILSSIVLFIVDKIIVYSPNLIFEWNLETYHHKIQIAHRHFLDFATFNVTTPYTNRPPLIGYIGRFSGEKGIHHFVQALPAILSERKELGAFIAGDGQLKEPIKTSLLKAGLMNRVDLPGWISHDDLPHYLNQLRLLVLPSYTEGLPNIMLEAMACGTPVLATPVGAIPDVIIDGKNGFIMENNTPECIAENVTRALESTNLNHISENAMKLVEETYTFEKSVERWGNLLKQNLTNISNEK